MYHVKHLCNQRPNGFKESSPKLKSYSEMVEAIHNLKSIYLSRIAVSRDYMGTGVAIRLIGEFMKHVDTGTVANLHVKDDNGCAINFYNKIVVCFSPYYSTQSRQLQTQRYSYRLMSAK